MFTQEKYTQLLHLLQKNTVGDTNVSANMADNYDACANMAGNYTCIDTKSSKWIVDTGATNHMTGDKDLLNNNMSTDNAGQVQLPTGDSTAVTHVGNHQLTGGDVFKNVLCVPAFTFNLLSVSKLIKELNCSATFFPIFFVFQDLLSGKVKEIDMFSPRAVRLVLLGYAPLQKGYKLSDLENGVPFVSRDVTFHEDVFPFKESSYTSEQLFLDIPVVPRHDIVEEAPTTVAIPSTPSVHTPIDHNSAEGSQESFNNPHVQVPTDLGNEEMMQEQVAPAHESSTADSQDWPVVDSSIQLPAIHSQEADVRKSTRTSKPPVWLQYYVTEGRELELIATD
ncbi:hypothetical protein A4A49_02020 [Nicotiana attenuata]|uniref:Retrovirus-related pol polyprotein from transposon tnt 1-94 n=1 Tax=Nicotiana attenuata TaxID=49451 RepID=A0A314LAP0_NICAT|nr:hypothetical protein A4A49_02020 [Nicotiana attenuata]